MEIKDFVLAISKLEKYYDKEYTEDQRKIMYDSLKNLNIKELNRAITNVLNTSKYLPKIADIKSALNQPQPYNENKIKIEFYKCQKCNDGFIQYFKKIKDGNSVIEYPYIALCDCENGKLQKEVNKCNFPFIYQVLKK